MGKFARFMNLREVWRDLRLAWRLLGDRRVPPAVKLVPLAFLLYVVWPLDLVSDAIPLLGQLDDLGILLLGLRLFLHLAPRDVVVAQRIRADR